MNLASLRILYQQWRAGKYSKPSHIKLVLDQLFDVEQNLRLYTDRDHLKAAISWLMRAQDAMLDGGIAGRYSLRAGWTSSYPETTGYIIPTLLRLAEEEREEEFLRRAGRAVDFLLKIQLPCGAFPGLEIADNTSSPSPFNTAQIMHGLQAWGKKTRDDRCIAALRRAGNWLCEIQEPSGAWQQFFYLNLATTYSAHLTCWLAEAGEFLGDDRMLGAASKHLSWVLEHYDANHGWFELCGFTKQDHELRRAVTHTIAYTLWGVLRTAQVVGSAQGKAAAEKGAYEVARRLELSRQLPGVLDYRWRPQSSFTCLTGNAQMALIWLHIYKQNGDPRLLNAALKAIDIVKTAQVMTSKESGVLGGIAGSNPIWGDYIPHAFPNWAVKYFIDALLAKKQALSEDIPFYSKPISCVDTVPTSLPPTVNSQVGTNFRVAMVTSRWATRVMDFLDVWSSWGFRPDLVLVEHPKVLPLWPRARNRLFQGWRRQAQSEGRPANVEASFAALTAPKHPSVSDFCRQAGIFVAEVESVNTVEAAKLIGENRIDLLIYAGAGILKKDLIEAARVGVLNAHMGLLPSYRGMNVTEWSAWNSDPIGCTVHLIDPGIDTGDILLVRRVDTSNATSVGEMRHLVDRCQIELLGEVLKYALKTGQLPPRRPQSADEGLQYFRMHPLLVNVLNERLRAAAHSSQRAITPTISLREPESKTDLHKMF